MCGRGKINLCHILACEKCKILYSIIINHSDIKPLTTSGNFLDRNFWPPLSPLILLGPILYVFMLVYGSFGWWHCPNQDGLSYWNSSSLKFVILEKFQSLYGSLCWSHCPKQDGLSQGNSNSLKFVILENF